MLIEVAPGRFTDHYDPTVRVVRLSEDVYYGSSIASVSVAAHEVGHAIQHDQSYGFLSLRHKMFPVANIASGIARFLLLGGSLFQAFSLMEIGIIFFSAAVAFQLITLPLEFNASARAKQLMLAEGMITDQDTKGVNKVLEVATLISVLELVKYVMIFFQENEED